MAFTFHQIATNERVQTGVQQLVDHALGLAFVTLFLGDLDAVTGQHFLHFFRWQEDVSPLIQRNKAETPIGGFDGTRKDNLVFLDIGFQLAQLAEGVGIEHEQNLAG